VVGNTGTDSVDSTTGTPAPGPIDCPGTRCSADFNLNDSVTLNVTVDAASSFWGWGGDCAPFGSSLSGAITMDGDKNCTCTFQDIDKGDADGDGDRDIIDVRLCLQIAIGVLVPTPEQRDQCDGDVDETDAQILAEFIIGMRTTLP